jgi:hypothetical protein
MDNSNSSNSINPEELVAALRAYRQQIPEYTQENGLTGLNAAANLNRDFIEAGVNAIGAAETLQHALNTTPAECLQESSDSARWSAVEDELTALLIGVRNANLVRRHRLGIKVLQAYQVSKQLARTEAGADLRPHVGEMRRHLRGGRRKKAGQTPNPSTPASA